MKMINKIIEDIEKYIINFKDSNFGNLESLNKYKLENLEFKNWEHNNLKVSFIIIKNDNTTNFINFLDSFIKENFRYC